MKLILRETQWCVKYLLCPIVCHLLNLYKWSNQLKDFIDSRNCRSYGNDISLRDFNLKWKMFLWKMKDIKKKISWWQFIELMAIHQIPKYLTKNGNYFLFFIYSKHLDRRHIVFYFYRILSKNDRCYVINQKATCNSFFFINKLKV